MGEVCVFRKSEADNYEFLPEPLVLDVVTAAAVPHPPLQMAPDDSDEPVMEPDAEETLARTLDTVLRACCEARAWVGVWCHRLRRVRKSTNACGEALAAGAVVSRLSCK